MIFFLFDMSDETIVSLRVSIIGICWEKCERRSSGGEKAFLGKAGEYKNGIPRREIYCCRWMRIVPLKVDNCTRAFPARWEPTKFDIEVRCPNCGDPAANSPPSNLPRTVEA